MFVFDNARTHQKQAEGVQSALRMIKGSSKNFMVEVNDLREDGGLRYSKDGKILKKKVPMSNGKFSDGTEQEFYWPENADNRLAGQFKGMVRILEECGYHNMSNLKAQCGKKISDCLPGKTNCCCCWTNLISSMSN